MLQRLRGHLSYANVTATVALFLALGGGAVYAAGKIRSGDIAANAVRSKHVKNDSLTGKDVKESTLTLPAGPPGAPGADGADGADGSPDTPQQVLGKLTTVDGSGSDLDADTIDGLDSTNFLPSSRIVPMQGGSTASEAQPPERLVFPPAGGLELRLVCERSPSEAIVSLEARKQGGEGVGNLAWQLAPHDGTELLRGSAQVGNEFAPVSGFVLTVENSGGIARTASGTLVYDYIAGETVVAVPYRLRVARSLANGLCRFAGVATVG